MSAFREVWNAKNYPQNLYDDTFKEIIAIEKSAINGLQIFIDIIETFIGENEAIQAKELISTANIDLIAGCEMARFGYLKQAYTLWRSWYEQVLFSLYFLEAPIHRQAWKVSESVSISDSPKYRLMLHQLLADSSEKHAFTLVYADRYIKILESLKKTNVPKSNYTLARAGKILTVLSQGVHGTYRPTISKDNSELSKQLTQHCLPTLQNAWKTVSEMWLLFITNVVDLPETSLISLSKGSLSILDAIEAYPNEYDRERELHLAVSKESILILSLNTVFPQSFT